MTKLLSREADSRRIDNWCKLLQIIDEHAIEECLISVLEAHQALELDILQEKQ